MSDPVLQVRGLRVTLHRGGTAVQALDGIDLDLRAGEILALVGESGSGKSTLGLAVQGLLPAEARPLIEGSLQLAGEELIDRAPRKARALRAAAVRAVFQDALGALNPSMTIGAQMAEVLPDRAAARDWLARVDLPEPETLLAKWPHQLSGGQRQRVLIAMAMAAGPRLLIADEPTTALDVTVQAQIVRLIRDLARERGTAVIFVTHDLALAADLAERVAVLYAGRMAEIGPTRGLIRAPAHAYTSALLAARFDLSADRGRPLHTLPGDPPQAGPVPGCAFAPRCPLVAPDCRTARPPLVRAPRHGGRTACRRAGEVAASRQVALAPWPASPRVETMPALELSGVSKSFARPGRGLLGARQVTRAVDAVSLVVPAGGSLAIVGESGSGKSTVLRLAAGLMRPDAGTVRRDPGDRPQMIHQDAAASFTPWLTIGEQIAERLRPLRLPPAERAARVAGALSDVGLAGAGEALPEELSGGQCQRAAIARAVVVPPRLLLCDEPVSAMDVSLAAQTLNLLGRLRRELGLALVFVTHDLAAARIVADRIVVMQSGHIVEQGPAEEITRAPATDYARILLASMPRLERDGAA